jgi:cytoskeletal protein RodZ
VGTFGEKLRKQREQRGLELDAISNTTKISPRMLRALEDEHFEQLPGGVFNKGFVRAYARQVGLDEEETIAEYLAALRESQIQQQTILPDFRSPAGIARKSAGPEPIPNLDHAAQNKNILQDLHRGKLASKNARPEKVVPPVPMNAPANNARPSDEPRQSKPHQPESRQSEPFEPDTREEDRGPAEAEIFPTQGFITGPTSVPQTDGSAPIPWKQFAAALLVIIVLFAFWNLRHHSEAKTAAQLLQPVPTEQSSPLPLASAPAQTSPPTVASTTPAPKPAPNLSSPAENPAPTAKPAVATASKPIPTTSLPPTAKPRPHASAIKPPPTFTLLIRAEKTTWVSIVADGKPVAEETLIAPAHTAVRASHEIYVRAGNAAGVSFVLNGKEIPARGAEGEVKAYVFDATGLHAAPQSLAPPLNR